MGTFTKFLSALKRLESGLISIKLNNGKKKQKKQKTEVLESN